MGDKLECATDPAVYSNSQSIHLLDKFQFFPLKVEFYKYNIIDELVTCDILDDSIRFTLVNFLVGGMMIQPFKVLMRIRRLL